MPGQQALYKLMGLNTDHHAPVIHIYTQEVSPRLQYTCEFIFKHVLGLHVLITSELEEWQHSKHYAINYSSGVLDKGLHITPHGLLFESGVATEKPEATFIKENIYFYAYKDAADNALPFDVFSAVFYFISRYEEWQPFTRDKHGRFEAKESILYKHKAHLRPVVDAWVYELKAALEKRYPALAFPKKEFRPISTIDVDNLFAYKHKGLLRTIGACVKDLLRGDLKNLLSRLRVVLGMQQDPFDVYQDITTFAVEQELPLLFFFLFRTGTQYDRTVDPESKAFERVFIILKNKGALGGLHPSYDSAFEKGMMAREVSAFSKKWGRPVTLSRQHFLRFDITTTPHLLIRQGIQADFTMGFASEPGFRAGTSQPFFYYDLKAERKEDLLFVPFCTMDGAYVVYDKASPESAFRSMWQLAVEIRKVNGLFISVFHERTFSDHLYRGFGGLYKNLYLKLKEL